MRNYRTKRQNVFKSFFMAHINLYICLIILFLLGIVVGAVHSGFVKDENLIESFRYITDFMTALKTKKIDVDILLREFLWNNLKPGFLLWLLGLVILGIPLIFIYIAFEGYSLGFAFALVIKGLGGSKGTLLISLAVLPQEMIIIPVLLTLAVNSILFARAIWQKKERNTNIKFDIYRYIFLFIAGMVMLVAISMIQTYLQMPLVKNLIGYIS
ncbi:MAG: stage II sporulation protein M [Clostridia bacterium]|nr:stage II sporulation protein M [Clostridia bacterium]